MSETARTLDQYLSDPYNQGIIQDLEQINIDPLAFFPLFYDLVNLQDQGKPSEILKILDLYDFQGGMRLYVLNRLLGKLRNEIGVVAGFSSDSLSDHQQASLYLLDKEYSRVHTEFPPDLFASNDNQSDRARVQVAATEMSVTVIGNMLKRAFEEARERAERDETVELRARQDERQRIEQEQLRIAHEVAAAVKGKPKNPEFTTNRQVIALGFMLKRLGVKNIDKTVQAAFIEFLTGKNKKEIYDRVRELNLTIFTNKSADGRYVQDWFEKLGLEDMAKQLEMLLDSESEEF